MLAGNLKLNHFLIIATVVGASGATGLYFACRGDGDGQADSSKTKLELPKRPSTALGREPDLPAHQPAKGSSVAADDGLREVDRALVAWLGKDLGTKKIKDAHKGKPWKVNLYQDAGAAAISRAKVDLDRDGKWDEKWTYDGANISRKVAPADDESYTEKYDWDGKAWAKR